MMRLGIMGGTFDPIHYGHLVTAEEALAQFKLDEVVFMPTGQPARKTHKRVSAAEDRYLMTAIATASHPKFSVSRMEIDRSGTTYTIDTIREMHALYGDGVDLFFITGADAILDILTWKSSERLADLCTLIAATRPGYDLSPLRARVFPAAHRVEIMEVPLLAISSTDIRHRMASGGPVRYLLPEDVAAYARKHALYAQVRTPAEGQRL